MTNPKGHEQVNSIISLRSGKQVDNEVVVPKSDAYSDSQDNDDERGEKHQSCSQMTCKSAQSLLQTNMIYPYLMCLEFRLLKD